MKSCRSEAYTLMELLIAMSLLVILGGGLVSLMSQAVRIWNTAENRGRVYEEARAVLDRIAEDLRSVVVRTHAAEGDSWVRFLADADPGGRQRLRFVRTIPGEAADAILREGGRLLSVRTPAACDGQGDSKEAAAGLLAAPGGLMEVLYAADPRPGGRTIWRGTRSPIGGPDSLFVDRNVEPSPEAARLRADPGKKAPAAKDAPARDAAAGEDCHLSKTALPIASSVLFLGFSFWTQGTNTWSTASPPLKDPKPGEASGPSPWWDSTRGLLDMEGGANELAWRRRPGSLDDPRDDVFPELVEVTVVVAERGETLGTRLVEDANEAAKSLVLSSAVELPENPLDRFVRVDDEWIQIEGSDGNRLSVAAHGRGARWTRAAAHDRGARVELGVAFRRVIEIPGFRTEPAEEDGRRRGRTLREGPRR